LAINTHGQKIYNSTSIFDESWANSDMPLFRGRSLYLEDISRTSEQFVEINYMQVGLSIAHISVV
jgi:hypothetical protein